MVPFLEGLTHRDPALQRAAVRALGRLERPALVPQVALGFGSPDAGVRAETARALAQSATAGSAADARRELVARLTVETSALVRGAIAAAIGLLPYETADGVAAASRDVLSAAPFGPSDTPELLWGIVSGLESLARLRAKIGHLTDDALAVLRQAASEGRTPGPGTEAVEAHARIRRLAVLALISAGGAEDSALRAALDDPDDQVRRLAYRAAIGSATEPLPIVRRGIADGAWLVRFESLAAGRRLTEALPCSLVRSLLDDPNPHVALAAIDATPASCVEEAEVVERLRASVVPTSDAVPAQEETPAGTAALQGRWHRRARALAALASLDPDWTRERLNTLARDEVWQVRVAALAAAATLGDVPMLERLAVDPSNNVREAALRPLVDARGAAAAPLLLDALKRDDPQLVLTAANALEKQPASGETAAALAEALDRFTALKRETSRDTRLALLGGLGRHGGPGHAPRLRSYLEDFDPAVARRAADLLTTLTGEPHQAQPKPLPREPLPSLDDLRRMGSVRIVLHMASGAEVEVRLLPDEAPLNAFRFLRLAETGYYDGLTFHRVVPGFVVQGGSPGANEYWGAGPFSRDEVGVSNLRGTVGLSTRGRDTGDAQFYVNLVDNVRLDHDYTVFAEVVSGMADVDALLEGEVIERVEVGVSDRDERP